MDKYQTFRFKKFNINHQKSGMKIGTDGVLLGAWANLEGCESVLDLGTGSGLVALMCVQRYEKIDVVGIDIDKEASIQAENNFKDSPFFSQLKSLHFSFNEFIQSTDKKFDAIVSNPPFFKNSFKTDNQQRNMARHSDHLSLNDLFSNAKKVLVNSGKLILIYPFDQLEDIHKIASENSFHNTKQVNISHNNTKLPKRVLLEYLYKDNSRKPIIENFYLKNHDNEFSDEYILLTKDFHPFLI